MSFAQESRSSMATASLSWSFSGISKPFFFHPRIYILILEREKVVSGGRSIDVRNIDRLPLVRAPTGD